MYIYYTTIICIYFIQQVPKNENKKKGWHILKTELYENANWQTKFLLLFIIEETEIIGYFDNIVSHFKVLFGVKYITRQYYI